MIILDTEVWVLLMDGSAEISPSTRESLEEAALDGSLFLPVVAVWELASWEKSGQIVLSMPCAEWVNRALIAPGLSVAEFSPQIAVEGANLPGDFHRDPIDRIIVATARQVNGQVATRDRRILDYGTAGHVRVLPA